MSLLLDSSVFLWWMEGGETLSPSIIASIAAADERVAISVATVWELEIKHRSGKLDLPVDAWDDLGAFDLLEIDHSDALAAARLPLHHRDPFDRMIIAQAIRRGLTIVTSDASFAAYHGSIIRV